MAERWTQVWSLADLRKFIVERAGGGTVDLCTYEDNWRSRTDLEGLAAIEAHVIIRIQKYGFVNVCPYLV